jgi:hypothetical protein
MNTREIVDFLRYLCENIEDNLEFLDGNGTFVLEEDAQQAVLAAIKILEKLED